MKNVYEMTVQEVLHQYESGAQGLHEAEAARRRAQYGPNELETQRRKNVVLLFLSQFRDFLVLLLLAAAGISFALGDAESTAVILLVLAVNAALGTAQEIKAEQSLESLKKMAAPQAKVLRGGEIRQISAAEVTVGDIVLLEAGDAVCADGRVLEGASLQVNESALTGESLRVEKTVDALAGELPLGDRKNMVYAGSFVSYGRGRFLVTAVGMETEMGKIAQLLKQAADKKTPLQISLDAFGKKLALLILLICGAVFALNVWQGSALSEAFLFAVALAVAAIPEALSSIVTIVLAFSTRRMAAEHAVIRKLQAVESLGCVSVICSDKTGTLTQNKMTVQQCYFSGAVHEADAVPVHDGAAQRMLEGCVLCNDAELSDGKEIGDPTETALLSLAERCGVDWRALRTQAVRRGEIPFDSARKRMSVLCTRDGETILYTKGAPDVLLCRVTMIEDAAGPRPITQADRDAIRAANARFSQNGLRVLAFACKKPDGAAEITPEDETDLTFLALAAMSDPPRPESAAAVKSCISAGILPVMITGDHKETAAAIARTVGILQPPRRAVEGAELDGMDDAALRQAVPDIAVYARVTPEHKLRIVRAWQERGHIVAMTGDGVNDAPALKQSDIGVAMGITGTEVAKDAAAMVLTDDNFATIVKAVENGRNVYANIKRSIRFLLSGNAAGIFSVLYACLLALPVPFAAVHLLFINLLTDSLPAIALGLNPHSGAVMSEKPRGREEAILSRPMLLRILLEGGVIALNTMLAFHIGLRFGAANGMESAAVGSTMAFATLCLSRLLHGYHCKAERPVLFSREMWNNRYLNLSVLTGMALLFVVLLVPPLAAALQVAALPGALYGVICLCAAASLLENQIVRALLCRRKR